MTLKEFREKNDIKQRELAQFWGVTPAYVSQIESGYRPIGTRLMRKLNENDKGWDVSGLRDLTYGNLGVTIDNITGEGANDSSKGDVSHNVAIGATPIRLTSGASRQNLEYAYQRKIEILIAEYEKKLAVITAERDKLKDERDWLREMLSKK